MIPSLKCRKLVALIALSHFCLRFSFLSRSLLHISGRKVSQTVRKLKVSPSVAKLSQKQIHKVVAKFVAKCHKVVAKCRKAVVKSVAKLPQSCVHANFILWKRGFDYLNGC